MIDIHCHILYGVDDGARNLEESVEMAKLAYEDGIRHIYATPHFNKRFQLKRSNIEKRVASLQQTLDQLNIDVKIYPGHEVRLESPSFVYEHAEQEHIALIGKEEKFVLLEQRWKQYEKKTVEVVKWFMEQSIRPIIPHPERHFFFRESPRLLTELIEHGAWAQISADSLIGKNSNDALEFAKRLAENDQIHILATDAHNVKRKPNLSEGYRIIREWCGEKRIEEIDDRAQRFL